MTARGQDIVIIRRMLNGRNFIAIVNRTLDNMSICFRASDIAPCRGMKRQGDLLIAEIPALCTAYFDEVE